MPIINDKFLDMKKLSVLSRFAVGIVIINLSIHADNLLAASHSKVIQTEAITMLGNRSVENDRKSSFQPFKAGEKVIDTKSLTFTGKRNQEP